MSDRHPDERLASGLLAEEARARGPGVGSEALLEKIVEHELATERRVRRAAIASWSAVLVAALLLGAALGLGGAARGWFHSVLAVAFYVAPLLGILALVLAVLTTAAWLFRPRAASLAIIERRLADLEVLLRSGR